jgi:hypothetical protein
MSRGKDLKPRASTLTAQAAFRERLARFGVVLLEPQWRGATARYACRCPAGHPCSVSPHKLSQGRRPCAKCPEVTDLVAEQKFRDAVARAGGTVTGEYADTRTLVEVTCPAGHKNKIFPTGIIQGRGICRTCAGKDPADSERRFREAVAAQGGTCPGVWANSATAISCICRAGHDCRPQPSSVLRGQGICCVCAAGGEWDIFYVATDPVAGLVKFGITTRDPRPRLRTHASQGFTQIAKLAAGLPGSVARDTENAVKAALALAGEKPARGREYFPPHCLALILDVADSWLNSTEATGPQVVRTWVQDALLAA